jgi:hypothetical protein
MTHIVEYHAEDNLVHLTITGNFDIPAMEAVILDTGQVIKQHDCYRILTDLRNARVSVPMTELYEFPARINKIMQDVGVNLYLTRRAFVINNDLPLMRFYELVATNRGHTTRLFMNIEEARDWVKMY